MEKRQALRQRSVDEEKEFAKKKKTLVSSITRILKKEARHLTRDEKDFLELNDEMAQTIKTKIENRSEKEDRKREWEDTTEVLLSKCAKLADAIKRSKRLVVYTGAGISTSANIPDYRGPNGVWTLMDQGKEVAACDLGLAQPTTAHMALFMLYKQGKISHIVSQNCDGLHLRSGMPRSKLSEVHGNMFIEVCKTCKPVRPFVRLFDVTERTNRYRHSTRRRCYICGSGLVDSIVHFGERGSIAWPINWNGASRAAEKADMILCLGSSLKVLRRYPWLWCMDRPANKRPPLYIVNLQWTPKDSAATLKLNGRCDFVLTEVLKHLRMKLPEYTPYNDPLLSYATHLHEKEEHTTSRRTLIESKPVGVNQISMEASVSPTGVITEVRVSNKFTTAKDEFEYMSSETRRGERGHVPRVGDSGSRTVKCNSDSISTVNHLLDSSSDESDSENSHHSSTVNGISHSQNGVSHQNGTTESFNPSLTPDGNSPPPQSLSSISKKPKLEQDCTLKSLSNCDPLEDGEENLDKFFEDRSNLCPIPSPDHNYVISPRKDPTSEDIKSDSFIGLIGEIKTELKEEPLEEDNCGGKCSKIIKEENSHERPTQNETEEKEKPEGRYKLRKQKSPRYNQFDDEYFILCQEELLKQVQRNRKKKLETKIKKAIEENEEFKKLEYRTIDWDKDALYFSYEPTFLFTESDEEGEEEFVCECCDPKRRKKTASSEEGSEKEEMSELDEEIKEIHTDDDEINDLLEDDSDDETENSVSREESPLENNTVITNDTPKANKPMAPGWFGKGRRKKGKVK